MDEVALESNVVKNFDISEFTINSLSEALFRDNDFGVIYIQNIYYKMKKGGRTSVRYTSILSQVSYDIIIGITDRGDMISQVAIARMALIRAFEKSTLGLERYCNIEIQSAKVADPNAENNQVTQYLSGINLLLTFAN